MPDSHFPSAPATGLPPQAARAGASGTREADDFALGCECANPALQIERWEPATAVPSPTHAEPQH